MQINISQILYDILKIKRDYFILNENSMFYEIFAFFDMNNSIYQTLTFLIYNN